MSLIYWNTKMSTSTVSKLWLKSFHFNLAYPYLNFRHHIATKRKRIRRQQIPIWEWELSCGRFQLEEWFSDIFSILFYWKLNQWSDFIENFIWKSFEGSQSKCQKSKSLQNWDFMSSIVIVREIHIITRWRCI